MPEAGHQFRRVYGHLHLPKLRAALEAHFTRNVTAVLGVGLVSRASEDDPVGRG